MTHPKLKTLIHKVELMRKEQLKFEKETSSIARDKIKREARVYGMAVDLLIVECRNIIEAEQIKMFE